MILALHPFLVGYTAVSYDIDTVFHRDALPFFSFSYLACTRVALHGLPDSIYIHRVICLTLHETVDSVENQARSSDTGGTFEKKGE